MLDRRWRTARFGPFEADLVTHELRRDGVLVPLQQQPFRLLRVLIERQGELVTRDELRHLIWSEGTHVAFDRGLTSALHKVRAALGDTAGASVYIETLPGRGYRFRAPVVLSAAPAAAPLTPVGVVSRARWPGRALACSLALALIAAAGQPGAVPRHAERLAAAEALSAYACLLKSQGRFEEGLQAIERAHALVPESARFTAEVGFHLHAARRFDDEFPMLHRAVAQDAASPDAWLHLGLGYARRERFQEAVGALERAVALSHQPAGARFWLDWARDQLRRHAVS